MQKALILWSETVHWYREVHYCQVRYMYHFNHCFSFKYPFDRDLWGAEFPGGGSWPAVCPHCSGKHWCPRFTTWRRSAEQVSAIRILWVERHCLSSNLFPVCCRRNCIISAYYEKKEAHKPTTPNVSVCIYIKLSQLLYQYYGISERVSIYAQSLNSRPHFSPGAWCFWEARLGSVVWETSQEHNQWQNKNCFHYVAIQSITKGNLTKEYCRIPPAKQHPDVTSKMQFVDYRFYISTI